MSSEKQLAQRLKNVELMAELKRAKTHCGCGEPLVIVATKGTRGCKKCRVEIAIASRTRVGIQLKLNKDDKRHGTPYGYYCGCHCARCTVAESKNLEEQKKKKKNA